MVTSQEMTTGSNDPLLNMPKQPVETARSAQGSKASNAVHNEHRSRLPGHTSAKVFSTSFPCRTLQNFTMSRNCDKKCLSLTATFWSVWVPQVSHTWCARTHERLERDTSKHIETHRDTSNSLDLSVSKSRKGHHRAMTAKLVSNLSQAAHSFQTYTSKPVGYVILHAS